MRVHSNWETEAFDRAPVSAAVGPFPHREFLRAVEPHDAGETVFWESDEGLLAVSQHPDRLALAGDPDLTDYHSPLGDGIAELVAEAVSALSPGTEIDFDSLPEEAAKPIISGMEQAGLDPVFASHEVAAVVQLPPTFDEYLDMIGKKQRHEVRRKRRRYEEVVGALRHETHRGQGWAFEEFVRLLRMAPGEKGAFMTPERESLFAELVTTAGWRIDVLRIPDTEKASACLFSYADDEGFYLYNGSYDPDLGDGSPGIALTGSMIEQAIAEGLPRFDFLKGDEVYKFRLGAEARPLYRVRARR